MFCSLSFVLSRSFSLYKESESERKKTKKKAFSKVSRIWNTQCNNKSKYTMSVCIICRMRGERARLFICLLDYHAIIIDKIFVPRCLMFPTFGVFFLRYALHIMQLYLCYYAERYHLSLYLSSEAKIGNN